MGVYTHAFIEPETPDHGISNSFENRIVYNTLKFHWTVKKDLISDIPYEVSLFYFLEDTTISSKNEDAQILLKSILFNFEDFSTTQKVDCKLNTNSAKGTS
jgi:hypothetical protein